MIKFDEQTKAELDREVFKSERRDAVNAIKVEVDGKVFDGDERSQERMARALIGMNDEETILWVLADNTPVSVSKAQLREALRLAGQRQTELWVQ